MPLTLIRVDDRLIHGQVMAVWLRARGADRILVIDDETAQDEFLSEVLTYAAPSGVEVEVYSVKDGVGPLMALVDSAEPAFALMKTPEVALELVRSGVKIPVLNIGGMGAGGDRRPFYKNISASPAEIQQMKDLEALGTRIELQIVAHDKPIMFASINTKQGG